MISRYWIIICCFFFTACSSSIENGTNYFQLASLTETESVKVSVPVENEIWLAGVHVSDYLNSSGIVYQTNDVTYNSANNNLWASNLSYQLRQTLLSSLNRQLNNYQVILTPRSNIDKQLVVNITGFHGRYDGKAIVSGSWIFTDKEKITRRDFSLELEQPEDGYASLVRTLDLLWQRQLNLIVSEINSQLHTDH